MKPLFALLAAALLLVALPARAQTPSLAEAQTAYQDAEFDRALDLFAAIAHADGIDRGTREVALHHLSRLYIAKSLYDEARQALTELLSLPPPVAELDPDMEPPPLMNLYYEVRTEINKRGDDGASPYTVTSASPAVRTLAVMDFRNYAMSDHERYDPMQWGLSSMMIEQLSGATDLQLIDRENIQWLLQELDLQREPGRVDQATAVQMGRLLGAHAMVFGGLYVQGKNLRLSARVVKVETGEILLGESVEGREKDFFDLLGQLSHRVAQALNSTASTADLRPETETRSLDAMLSYSQGLSLLDQGDYRGAYEKFLEALRYDAGYAKAQLKIESLRPMLAAASTGEVLPASTGAQDGPGY